MILENQKCTSFGNLQKQPNCIKSTKQRSLKYGYMHLSSIKAIFSISSLEKVGSCMFSDSAFIKNVTPRKRPFHPSALQSMVHVSAPFFNSLGLVVTDHLGKSG